MKNTTSKFPSGIDERFFWSDINISQMPIINDYYKYLNGENYTMASELLNNSEVFFYGAWLLNLLESRLNAVGKYVSTMEKDKLIVYSDTLPSDDTCYDNMNWIGSNDDIIPLKEDCLDIFHNIFFGIDNPSNSNYSIGDAWINTDNSPNIYVSKDELNYCFSETEPEVSVGDEYNTIWIGDE